ncbi:hypothetical protein BOTCAL_0694g00030 [Botryotinia calthae]|uniref:Uncharacterized protein n=1 Tax=Botryotinia calthae TaxID=38488 RepID=A0A4Y8CH53_9HELO|nr:hypothetical protein BOTCAL_0694g00030 [Botryotinia calthae]
MAEGNLMTKVLEVKQGETSSGIGIDIGIGVDADRRAPVLHQHFTFSSGQMDVRDIDRASEGSVLYKPYIYYDIFTLLLECNNQEKAFQIQVYCLTLLEHRYQKSNGTALEVHLTREFPYRAAVTNIQQTQSRLGRIPRPWGYASSSSLIGD